MKHPKSAENRRSTRGDAQSSKRFKIEGPKRTKYLTLSLTVAPGSDIP